MKTKRLLALLAALIVPSAPATAEPESERLARGLMILHDGRLIFSPCRERSYVPVEDASPEREVTAALESLGLSDARQLYVELFGKAEGGMLRATSLNFAHTDARCHAPRPGGSWRAVGRAPGWRLTTGGKLARLQRDGVPDLESEISDGGDAQATTLRLGTGDTHFAIRRGVCRQTEDGFISGWTVEGVTSGAKLSGCAWRP